MNASEQIRLLRRACEMVMDWYGGKLTVSQFHDKWSPPAMSAAMLADRVYNDAMIATATPPDDDAARLTKERDEAKQTIRDVAVEAGAYYAVDDGIRIRFEAEPKDRILGRIKEIRQERDEALAKLAAKEKELADIYAAKPEPEYRRDGLSVMRKDWIRAVSCVSIDLAQRIADALNAGGGK